MSERKITLREYRAHAESKYGKKSVNETVLKMMDKATSGKGATRAEFERLNAGIKIAQTLESERRR